MKPVFTFVIMSCAAVPRRNNTSTMESTETVTNETLMVNISDSKSRIINGSPVNDAEMFPSYVSIRRYGFHHLCGGIILNHKFILTATHCQVRHSDTVIVGGIKRDGTDMQQELEIKNVFHHPGYISRTLQNDISIIELETELSFNSRVQSIDIGSDEEFVQILNATDPVCQVVGHGYTDGQRSVADQLQKTNQILTSEKTCLDYQINSDGCFLTQDKAGDSQVCHGDSGGPLYCEVGNGKKLFGIVSFVSATSCDQGFTGFTLPVRYKSFIDSHINNGSPLTKFHLIYIFILISTFI